jgi:hypothetical protein
MIEQFFKALSYLFHPLVMPILGVYFIFELPTIPTTLRIYDALFFFPDEAKIRIYIVLGVLTFAAPLLSLLIMFWNGMISSLYLDRKQDRTYPYFIVSFYYILAFTFVRYQWPEELRHPAFLGFLFGIILVNILTFILNFYTKVSAHAAASFGIVALLVAYNQTQIAFFENERFPNLYFILFVTVLSGLIVTGRLYLKAHKLSEVLIGMVLGFSVIYCCVKFEIYI